jgi:hypothetical protein
MEPAARLREPARMSFSVRTTAVVAAVAASMALPAGASAFHHGSIPPPECAASDVASNNPTARNAILVQNPVQDPGTTFPPFGTNGEGQADPNCALGR